MKSGSGMQVLTLSAANRMEMRERPIPVVEPDEILIKVGAVGLCGTDFHIYEGHANYNFDETGRVIPFEEEPLILGHEFCGQVVEVGGAVRDLKIGDRVVVDQGINCRSRGEAVLCEYCLTGNTHQCARYAEHGITGLQGALADYVAIPAVNAVRVESDLPVEEVAMTEPLGCVTHACEMLLKAPARYQFKGERPIKSILVCGAGPAGLLFTQFLRGVIGYQGLLVVTEPNSKRRQLADRYGATVIDPTTSDLVEAVQDLTHGEKINCLIESAGVAKLFTQMPGIIRKQATVVLYGHGHHGVDLGVINRLQFIEPVLVAPTGASGSIDADGRPATYRKSLELLSTGRINVSDLITHRYRSLTEVPRAFAEDHFSPDYIKGVAVLS